LIAPEGTPVLAIDDGVVLRGYTRFYRGTGYIVVRHRCGYIVRYCEVREEPGAVNAIRPLAAVSEGQVIAHVGRMHVDSMLHFELYRGDGRGEYSQKQNAPFQRRSDLIDPTLFLDGLYVSNSKPAT
jgi:murein DD-endopeptidase MepM/ murein hydrolase activator NlpD